MFASTAEAWSSFPSGERDPRVGILRRGRHDTLAALTANSHRVGRVNVAALHHRPGRSERLRYVYLTRRGAAQLKTLARPGLEVTAQGRPHRPPGAPRGLSREPRAALLLLAWGTLVGLDLVSVPQAMIARPLVAGPLRARCWATSRRDSSSVCCSSCFQYDILPMGADPLYPEYGPATVAAVSAAHAAAGTAALGLGAIGGTDHGDGRGLSLHALPAAEHATVRRATAASKRGPAGLDG